MILIDAGAFIARFRPSDDHHDLAQWGWARLEKNSSECCTTNLVIAETARAVARISGVIVAANMVQAILESDLLILRGGAEEEAEAIHLMLKHVDQRIGFVDCVSFAYMRKKKIEKVFGFDRHFSMAGFTLWPASKLKE